MTYSVSRDRKGCFAESQLKVDRVNIGGFFERTKGAVECYWQAKRLHHRSQMKTRRLSETHRRQLYAQVLQDILHRFVAGEITVGQLSAHERDAIHGQH